MKRLLAIGLFAACGSSSSGGGGACEARASELAAWATTVDRTYGGDLMAGDKLVEDPDAEPVTPGGVGGPTIGVSRDAISVDGKPAADASAVAARLGGATGRVTLSIDRDAPIALVAVAAAGAGARDVQLAVARPVKPMTPPPHSSVTDELAAAGGDATAVAPIVKRVIGGCPAFVRDLSDRDPAGAASKAQVIIDAIHPALVECGCSLDLDALRSTLWVLLGPGKNPPAGFVAVTLAGADEHDAAIVTGATWADAAPALFAAAAAGKHVRFVAPGR